MCVKHNSAEERAELHSVDGGDIATQCLHDKCGHRVSDMSVSYEQRGLMITGADLTRRQPWMKMSATGSTVMKGQWYAYMTGDGQYPRLRYNRLQRHVPQVEKMMGGRAEASPSVMVNLIIARWRWGRRSLILAQSIDKDLEILKVDLLEESTKV